jgi:pseudouridine-5'-phosphate glycosidase
VTAHFTLGFGAGLAVGNPIPVKGELPTEVYDLALNGLLSDAAAEGVRSRDVTPLLLERACGC